ncbi:AfsR/SARP family transcriptional regulator [Actinocrispum wychmicini]|uniref:DNA-binding SARP family transcriptional activator n=1 Tax=Actinocrispum wychmicini TaxID=1213861 RepID=A0A4R2J7W0_9PSEU|nr:BTAD domain-containing putative transcriptional regulator [Actinocrispum wychmicini]TCO54267.1 DNA-binding SARP family transcriptional activator [Actinocrispum wychmicini]
MGTQFRLLGQIEAEVDGQPVIIGYAQLRAVLAVLLVEVNRIVPVDQLVDRVWGSRPLPRSPRGGVQHSVTLLRTALAAVPETVITWEAPGYRLTADPTTVDLHEFHRLLDEARATESDERAMTLFTEALRQWRGEPFTGASTPWFETVRAMLVGQRQAAQHELTDLRLRNGQHGALIPELFELTQQLPLDERLAGQYLLALYRGGRPAQALEHYDRLRQLLAEELGTDPSPPLRRLHQQILTADPTLATPTPVTEPSPVPTPRQLPAPPRLFTGRTTELAALDEALDEPAGTVVISAIGGTGGIGKTWLASHWAHQRLDRFPDGQLHVDLRGFDPSGEPMSPATAVRAFLAALGVAPGAIPVELDAQVGLYRSLVAGKRMLVVLDNASDTGQVTPLLPGSPTCTVLVTSRYHLGGLITAHGARILDLDVLPEPEARSLLASHLGPDRVAAEPQAVSDLLAYCAGLPLALGIVAARAVHHRTFPLAVLAEELRDATARLDGLDAGDQRGDLRAVMSWSVRTLSPPAATLFGLLGIAPGADISLFAAASLAALPPGSTRALLRELERGSLVQQHTPGRYRMHDLIRLGATDTAQEHLTEDVRDAALRRVLDFYTHSAHSADRLLDPHGPSIPVDPPAADVYLRPIPDVPAALAWLDAEHPALLAAQRTAADHDWPDSVWQLAWPLDTFLYWRGHRHDRVAVWQSALDATAHLPDPAPGIHARRHLGRAHADLGCYDQATEHLHQALALAEHHQDPDQQARTHRVLASTWGRRGNDREALRHATQALDLLDALDQPEWEADARNVVGWYAARLGEYDTARTHCEAALTLHRQHRDPEGEANTLDSLGYIAHHTGRHQQAVGHYQQALTLLRDLGNTSEAANTLDRIGHPHAALGEHEQARTVWREASELYRQLGRHEDVHRVQRQLDDLSAAGVDEGGPGPDIR